MSFLAEHFLVLSQLSLGDVFHHTARAFGLIDLAGAWGREKCEGQLHRETDEDPSKRSFDLGLW